MAAAGDNEFRAEFFADIGDVDIQQVGERRVILVKEMLVKLGARDHFAAMQGEKLDEGIFTRGEFNRFSLKRDVAGGSMW